MNLPAGTPSRTTSVQPPGMFAQQREEHHQRAGDVDEHLDDVGPDHRRDAAALRVDRSSRRRASTTVTGTGTPVTMAITRAVANRRMPSASERVIRNSPAATVLTPDPKRCCSSW